MPFSELTVATAVRRAAKEYDYRGHASISAQYGLKEARFYAAVGEQLYEAFSLCCLAISFEHPERTVPSRQAVAEDARHALHRLGFVVSDRQPLDADGEREWRYLVQRHIDAVAASNNGYVSAGLLRELGAYGGGQGIWVDKARTVAIHRNGVAVGAAHTGMHYADDLSKQGALYHYPTTGRGAGRDASEVAAMKAAAELHLPVFVITRPTPHSSWRAVQLGWVEGWDDPARIFRVRFGGESPVEIVTEDHSDDEPFETKGNRSKNKTRTTRYRPDQPAFKFDVIQRYGARCPLSGIAVQEILDAAHLVPDSEGGTYDPRNGLPLTASLHRALDAALFAIHPDTHQVETRPQGPSLEDMGIRYDNLHLLKRKPHRDSLSWRYERFQSKLGG